MTRLVSSLVGALADAWAEIRVHKLRVLLSLIGIAASVAALTAVIAFSEYQQQYQVEQSDRYGGRAATISVSVMSVDGAPLDVRETDARVAQATERFGFSHATRIVQGTAIPVQLPDGVVDVPLRLYDPAYPVIHREELVEGRWFRDTDAEALAPPVIVSEALWDRLGRIPVAQHPLLEIAGATAGTYQIVGVTPRQGMWDEEPRVDMLYTSYLDRSETLPEGAWSNYEFWVGEEQAGEIGPVLAMDLRAGLPGGQEVGVSRTDWASQSGAEDAMRTFEIITTVIGGLILALGALSLINIQLVAMRQRVREIGVRRAFGATGARVFAAVLLESLVATTVAGIIGIAIVVAVMRSDLIVPVLFAGMQDVPPFPLRAAVTGLVASILVGALAGFVPALVALRVRVIDAIRF